MPVSVIGEVFGMKETPLPAYMPVIPPPEPEPTKDQPEGVYTLNLFTLVS